MRGLVQAYASIKNTNGLQSVAAKLGDYPRLGKSAAAAIPGAELVELDGVGHVPQVEAFDRTIAALRRFLAAPITAPRSPSR